jgi:hypothetical protein
MFLLRTIITFLRDEEYRDLLFTTIIILFGGSVFYHNIEGWSLVDSLYFCVVTLTTIGYGDFAPKTDLGKIFTVFYIIVGIGMILSFVKTIQHHFIHMRIKEKKEILKKKLNREERK